MRFELTKGNSNKFWEIALKGKGHVVTWGRIGTDGRSLKKTFPSSDAARDAHDKLVREKVREGYAQVGGPATAAAPAAAAAAIQSFFLHVSHHQFTVEDADHQGQKFTFEHLDDKLETQAHGAVVHLWRAACEIPIVIEVLPAPPPKPSWKFHVVSEGSFESTSGTLAVGSPEAAEPVLVKAPKGVLRIQVRQADLDTSSYDSGEGADHYRVLLWPGTPTKTRLLSSVELEEEVVLPAAMKLDAVAALLRSADVSDRCHAAAEAVRRLRAGDVKAFPFLAGAAKDASPVVRAVTASALGVAGPGEPAKVLGLLDALASDKSRSVRIRVPEALARLGGKAATARMLKAIAGKDADLAGEAANLLWMVTEDVDARELIPILKSPSPATRLAALTAIQGVGGADKWSAVAATGDAVRALLKDKDQAVRKLAAKLVEKLGAPLDALLKMARSPTTKMRESAARALGDTRDPGAYAPLLKLIADKDVGVRREAAAGLGALGDRKAVPILAKQLQDGTYNLNWYAARGLARLGGSEAVAALFRYVDQADADEKFDYIAREATEALGEMLDVAGGEERADGVSGDIDLADAAKRARKLAASKDERLRERGVALLEHVPGDR